MGRKLEHTTVYFLGAAVYGTMEMLFRGFTHWSMLLTGGLCFYLIYRISDRKDLPLWQKWLLGAGLITALEFTVGVIVNIALGWHVWDYSDHPLNIGGQVCLLFTGIWFVLCIGATALCAPLRRGLRYLFGS